MAGDVLAFGEALLRLQPVDDGRLEENGLLAAYPGGAELNTCFALAGLGVPASWFSVLPEGPLGRRILRHLRGGGVDCSQVRTAPGRLGTYWVEYGLDPRTIEVVYDRRDSTVCRVRREDVPWERCGRPPVPRSDHTRAQPRDARAASDAESARRRASRRHRPHYARAVAPPEAAPCSSASPARRRS